MRHRYTIKELDEWTDWEMFRMLIRERVTTTTNIYSPLNIRLGKLNRRVNKEIERGNM